MKFNLYGKQKNSLSKTKKKLNPNISVVSKENVEVISLSFFVRFPFLVTQPGLWFRFKGFVEAFLMLQWQCFWILEKKKNDLHCLLESMEILHKTISK